MTCEDYRWLIINTFPHDRPMTEVVAVIKHATECDECYRWVKDAGDDAGTRLSEETKALLKTGAKMIAERALEVIENDPEV